MKLLKVDLKPAAVAFFMTCTATAGLAQELPAPEGEILLTVTGAINSTNDGAKAVFDLAGLEKVGSVEIETTTIWTEGMQTFVGTPLVALMDALGVEEGTIRATAVNDYSVEIPLTDAVEDGAIVAYQRNGEAMSLRDKGPLWVIYPYDSNEDYQAEVYYARSIWQLDRMEIQP